MLEILNNRELAILFWITVFCIYFFSSAKMVEARKAFRNLLVSFFVKKIISIMILMIIYVLIIVYNLAEIGLWNVEQLKNTIFWSISVATLSLLKLNTIKKDKSFFKHSILNNLKILAIIQFIIGVYTFPLIVEVILIPVLFLISAMIAIADSDKKHAQVKRLLEYLLSIFGVIVIVYTVYMLLTNFGEITKEKTFYDFMVPVLLTFFYLPFIFIMIIYSTYEDVFSRLRFSIKNKMLRNIAMLYSVIVFNIRLDLLERWSRHIFIETVTSHRELIDSFKHIFKVRKAERIILDVPKEKGWSPYKAKEFLSQEGLVTGHYNKIFDEWQASSIMELGKELIPDNIAYYVQGTENIANVLKIKLNINDANRSNFAQNKLLDLSNVLSCASLKIELSDATKNAILNAQVYNELQGNKRVSVEKEVWSDHKFGGYSVKFIISTLSDLEQDHVH